MANTEKIDNLFDVKQIQLEINSVQSGLKSIIDSLENVEKTVKSATGFKDLSLSAKQLEVSLKSLKIQTAELKLKNEELLNASKQQALNAKIAADAENLASKQVQNNIKEEILLTRRLSEEQKAQREKLKTDKVIEKQTVAAPTVFDPNSVPFTSNLDGLAKEQSALTANGIAVNELDIKEGLLSSELAAQTRIINSNTEAVVKNSVVNKEEIAIKNKLSTEFEKAIVLESTENKLLLEQQLLNSKNVAGLKTEIALQNSATGSLEQAIIANKVLRAERNQLDLSTEAGKARRIELNTQIDANTKLIKENGDAAEKQAKNVGNYGSAFKGLYSGLRQIANILPGIGLAGVIGLAVDGITNLVQSLGLFNSKQKEAVFNSGEYSAELSKTGASVAEVRVKLEALINRTKESGITFKEKQFILSDYNKEFSGTIGEAKTYNDLETILINRAPSYITYLSLKAKAQAGFNLATQKANESFLASIKLEQFQAQRNDMEKKLLETGVLNRSEVRKSLQDIERQIQGTINKSEFDLKEINKLTDGFTKEAEKIRTVNDFDPTKTEKSKKVQVKKDETAAILAEARKQQFELKKIQEQEAIDEAERQGYNKSNFFDQRAIAFMEEFDLRRDLLKKEADFEVQEVANKLSRELKENKHNKSEIAALEEKTAADIAVIREKANSDQIKAAADTLNKIKGVDDERLKLQEEVQKSYREAELKFQKRLADDALDIQKKADKEKADANKKAKDEQEKREKEFQKKLFELAKEGVETIAAFVDGSFDRRKNQIQEEIDAIGVRKDKEIAAVEASTLSEQDKAAKLTQINIKAQADSEALQRRQRELDVKKAEFNKATTIANIIANTAQAISKAVAEFPLTGGAPFTFIAAAIGALQLAKVLATPIPKFAEGTDNAPGGIAMVGEKGSELIVAPSGDVSLTPSNATLMHLQKGSKVITADKVDQYLMNTAVKKMNIPTGINEVNYSQEMTQAITSELKRIGGIIESKQENHFHWDNGELRKAIKKGKQWTEWVNNYKS